MKSYIPIIILALVFLAGVAYYLSAKNTVPETTGTITENMPEQTQSGSPETDVILTDSRYVTYSKDAFDAAADKKRVYFFYAPWCPTCRPTDAEFKANLNRIPEDVMLFRTDYDTSTDLKKQYAVTYQHTFVLVDEAGREVKKWNGGGMDTLITNTN